MTKHVIVSAPWVKIMARDESFAFLTGEFPAEPATTTRTIDLKRVMAMEQMPAEQWDGYSEAAQSWAFRRMAEVGFMGFTHGVVPSHPGTQVEHWAREPYLGKWHTRFVRWHLRRMPASTSMVSVVVTCFGTYDQETDTFYEMGRR